MRSDKLQEFWEVWREKWNPCTCACVIQSYWAFLQKWGSPWRSGGDRASSCWGCISFLILSFLTWEERDFQCSHAEDKCKGPKHLRHHTCPSVSDTVIQAVRIFFWNSFKHYSTSQCYSLSNSQEEVILQRTKNDSALRSDGLTAVHLWQHIQAVHSVMKKQGKGCKENTLLKGGYQTSVSCSRGEEEMGGHRNTFLKN